MDSDCGRQQTSISGFQTHICTSEHTHTCKHTDTCAYQKQTSKQTTNKKQLTKPWTLVDESSQETSGDNQHSGKS